MTADPADAAYLLSIGVSEYPDPHYGNRESLASSAKALCAALSGENGIWAIPDGNSTVLTGYVTVRQCLYALKEAAAVPTDLLIVYLGCHGSRFMSNPDELQLALSDSDFDYFNLHLSFRQVKEILRNAVARRKLLLLDCCYADDSFLGARRDNTALEVVGVCTLAATEYRVEASSVWKDTGYTGFAGALVEVLEQGIADGPAELTISDVFEAVKIRMVAAGLPQPGMRGDADRLVLVRNPEYRPGPDEPDPAPELSPLLDLAPAAFAETMQEQPDGVDRLLAGFVDHRTLDDIASLIGEFAKGGQTGYATATAERVLAQRDSADFAALIHRQHQNPAVLDTLTGRSVDTFAVVLGGLLLRGCAECASAADELCGRPPVADWTSDQLVELLALLRRGTGSDAPRDRVLDALTIDRLSALATHLWEADDHRGMPPERRRDAVDAVERVAALAPPTQLYELAAGMAAGGQRELGNALLEAAADRRGAAELAELLRLAGADPDFAELLRFTVLRRHPPRFLLAVLDALPDGPRAALLACAAQQPQGLSVRDLSRLLLLLHHDGTGEMLDSALDAAVRHRTPDQLAAMTVQLYRYGGRRVAGLVTGRLVLAGPSAVEKTIEVMRLLQEAEQHLMVAATLNRAARDLPPDRVFHVACRLAELGFHDLARALVRRVVGRLAAHPAAAGDGALVSTLDRFTALPGAMDGQLPWLLGALTEFCTAQQVWTLITWVRPRCQAGEATVLNWVCRIWPVARMDELAAIMDHESYGALARRLMTEAIEVFAGHRTQGGEIAELILVLRRRLERRTFKKASQKLVVALAAKRDPEQVMRLIDRLVGADEYHPLHDVLRDAVVRNFDVEALIALPGVLRAKQLTIVQEIAMAALVSPARVPTEQVPSVLQALHDAGSPQEDLCDICRFVGARRRVDPLDVIHCLRAASLHAEATAYAKGTDPVRRRFYVP
ncbi:caspase family protein [Streptantibioticus rubrisoli]|uniref:Caspase family protein n=1 Tax=Streptantibioticus rubrisoli TaxID=1387313 RepID=A0ABT1P848_9ACTN|nr:caspase family protein [Streptantibioticus rubrisoli]MCQ4041545.1 caspase family protein [Streptantibioticus rubrisoli]